MIPPALAKLSQAASFMLISHSQGGVPMATVFEMIINGEIPSTRLYEDDEVLVILDINPVEKGHSLVISKTAYPDFTDCPADRLGHMMEIAQKVDLKLRSTLGCDGTNILINNGPAAGQEIPHLHIHVIPRYKDDGQTFGFEKTKYADGEIAQYGARLAL